MRLLTTRALAAVGTSAVLTVAGSVLAPVSATGTQVWAPAGHRHHPPRHDDVHRRRPVHRELRLHRRRRATPTSATPRTAPAPGAATDTDGCSTGSLPLGTQVDLQRGRQPGRRGHRVGTGTLAYSQLADHAAAARQKDPNTCAYNDLALVKVGPADVGKVNPRCRSGAARPASTPTAPPPVTGSTPTATPACAPGRARSRRTPASASATTPRTAAGRTRSTP